MKNTESVSKGIFTYLPKESSKRSRKSYNPLNIFESEEWHKGYTRVWEKIENKLNTIGDTAMQVLLDDLILFIDGSPSEDYLLPTVLLLTGVNLPDHCSLFSCLREQLTFLVTPHVAMLSSSDCTTIKHTIEQIVAQFTRKIIPVKNDDNDDDMDEMDIDDEPEDGYNIKRSDCTMPFLAKWYEECVRSNQEGIKNKLVIVLKDFEGFQANILHNLILILSGYRDRLPFVLVFGVATTEAAIGESLTHQITSRLMLKVFQSQPSVYFLNNTVDKVFLTPSCPFQLSGKLFKFFTDVFLFYDFSVNRFTQGIKYCLMDHFYEKNLVGLLCQKEKRLVKNIQSLDHELLEEVRSLPSFSSYIENHENKQGLLTNDEMTKMEILSLMVSLRRTIDKFYACLRALHVLVKDIPQSPLGKQLRELYCIAMSKDVTKTSEYKECQQLLNFISKDDLQTKLNEILSQVSEENEPEIVEVLNKFSSSIENIGVNSQTRSPRKSPTKLDLNVKNRAQLRQRLAEIGSRPQVKYGYEALREEIVKYFMEDLFPTNLIPYTEGAVLWELITVRDIDARNRIVPRIRAPIHTALNNPHHYLQCKCCEITDDHTILATMPDICIAYKLHLEGGSLINVYDWLQSFSVIVDSENEKPNPEDIDEKVQARFTQAVAELEFLGFIKSSKKKPDHVSRLTWGSTA